MYATKDNIGQLIALTEHAAEPLKTQKALELREALDRIHGVPYGFQEQYRVRLDAILSKPKHEGNT